MKLSTSYLRSSTSPHLAMMSTYSFQGVLQDQAQYICSSFALAPGSARGKYPVINCSCCTQYKSVQKSKAPLKRKNSSETLPEAAVVHIPSLTIPPAHLPREEESRVPLSAIPHDDLPVASVLPRVPQNPIFSPSEPLTIHSLSVAEHQHIYHVIVDEEFRRTKGQARRYRLAKGRRIKQKLWKLLGAPMFTTTEDADGRLHIALSYGAGVLPPQYEVDISNEPKPPNLS